MGSTISKQNSHTNKILLGINIIKYYLFLQSIFTNKYNQLETPFWQSKMHN